MYNVAICVWLAVFSIPYIFVALLHHVFAGIIFYVFGKQKNHLCEPYISSFMSRSMSGSFGKYKTAFKPCLMYLNYCTSTFSIASSRSPLPAVSFCHCLPLWYCTWRGCHCYCHGKIYFLLNAHSIKVSRRGG